MDNDTQKMFQMAGWLLKSLSKGLDEIAKQLDKISHDSPDRDEAEPPPAPEAAAQPAEASIDDDDAAARPAESLSEAKELTKTDIILEVISSSKNGMDINTIAEKTGFDKNSIRSAASRLRRQGKLTSKKRGVYMAI